MQSKDRQTRSEDTTATRRSASGTSGTSERVMPWLYSAKCSISTRRLRARFSGEDGGWKRGCVEPTPDHSILETLLIAGLIKFATAIARARDSSMLSAYLNERSG